MGSNETQLGEARLCGIEKLEDYPWFKERQRVFPAVFETRQHREQEIRLHLHKEDLWI